LPEYNVLPETESQKHKFFYGYIIVIAGFCIQMVVFGIQTSFGVFFNSLLLEFGWSRATISGAASLLSIMLGVSAIIVGRLSDRVGPRLVMVVSGVLFGLGCLLMSRINAVWQLYLFYGVLAGVGVSGADVMPLSTVARWFVKKRGMMSGILKVGTGVGILAIPLLASWLISNHGWRQSYVILGGIALASIILAAQFLRRDPAEKGLLPYGVVEVSGSSSDSVEESLSLKEAIHTGQFRIFCAICALFYFCMQTVMAHIVLNAIGLGIAVASAATVLSTIGGASIAGRVVVGIIVDKVGSRLSLIICFIILVAALLWLQAATELWSLYLFAVLYGFAHGGFFALLSPLVAELFGLTSHGAILGTAIFSGSVGGAIGPVLAGWIFDVTESYQIAFLICAALSVIALILAVLLRKMTTGKRLEFDAR